jgi:hypothetical protein
MLAGPHPRSLSLGRFAPRSGRRRSPRCHDDHDEICVLAIVSIVSIVFIAPAVGACQLNLVLALQVAWPVSRMRLSVVAPFGAGVYRALDRRLGRSVAVKVLPSQLARDDDRTRRFIGEARAALGHEAILLCQELGDRRGVDA